MWSRRTFKGRSRREILDEVRLTDQAVWYSPLTSGTDLTYKKTFSAADDDTIEDADVLKWTSWLDADEMFNEYHITGARVATDKVVETYTEDLSTDPGDFSKAKYAYTRTQIRKMQGLVTDYDSDQTAEYLVEKDDDILLYLTATLSGLDTSYRLGTKVAVTSTVLDLSGADYLVTRWQYDTKDHRTTITLHPRSSVGYTDPRGLQVGHKALYDKVREIEATMEVPSLSSQAVD